jgi:hypothetical protein
MLFVKEIGQIFSMPFFPRLDASPPQTYHKLSEIGAILDITIAR